ITFFGLGFLNIGLSGLMVAAAALIWGQESYIFQKLSTYTVDVAAVVTVGHYVRFVILIAFIYFYYRKRQALDEPLSILVLSGAVLWLSYEMILFDSPIIWTRTVIYFQVFLVALPFIVFRSYAVSRQ